MTDHSEEHDAFAAALEAAYREVRLHSPQGIDDVAQRLRSKLEQRGLTLTAGILRALSFAIVNGRDL